MKIKKYLPKLLTILFVLFLLVNIAMLFLPNVKAEVTFSDGFESGDFSEWYDTYGSPSIIESPVHHGDYAANMSGAGSGAGGQAIYQLLTTQDDVYFRLYVYFPSLPSNGSDCYFATIFSAGWSTYVRAGIANSDGTLYWILDTTTTAYEDEPATINAEQWYCVELRRKTGSGNGVSALYVDNSTIINLTSETQTVNAEYCYAGITWSTDAFSVIYDCAVVADVYTGTEEEEPPNDLPLTLHGIWTHTEEVNSTFLDRLESTQIWNVYLWVGEWKTDHTITYWASENDIITTINTIHARNSSFRVYPFLFWGDDEVDISNSTYRNAMYAEIEDLVNLGFDGFQDDLEYYVGTAQNYIDYLDGMTTTVHNLGKIASAAVMAGYGFDVETVYPALTLDYVVPMFYNGGPYTEEEMEYTVPRVLNYSSVPVSCGLRVDMPVERPYPLEDQLEWLDAITSSGEYSTYQGVSLWLYDDMPSGDWAVLAAWVEQHVSNDTYTIELSVDMPENTTYSSSTVNYNVTVSGNETLPLYQINAYYPNGTAVGANQTATSGSFTGLSNGTYTFACYVEGVHGEWDYQEVVFSVAIPDTYTLSLTVTTPENTTYTSSTVNYQVSNIGNETDLSYQINAYLEGSPVGANQTSTSGSFIGLSNGTYTFACYAIGANNASDYQEVVFSVAIPDTYTLSLTVTTPENTTYTSSTVTYSVGISGNETNPSYQINLYLYGSPVGANQTSTSGSFTELGNGVYMFACYVEGEHGLSDYQKVVFTVDVPLYTIVASAGSGGSITPSGNINVLSGANQTFTISPNIGYSISSLIVDSVPVEIASSYTFTTVASSHTITVYFTITTFTITASSDVNCTITPSGGVIVNYGNNQLFSYSANTGYEISQLIVDGVSVSFSSPTGTYTFTTVIANHTIAVYATAVEPTPTPTPTATPLPTPTSSPNPYNYPTETLTLYMRSDTYNFSDISAYGLDIDYTNTYISISITTTTENATITYGFRVFLMTSSSTFQELTSGTPQAQMSLSSNFTGQLSSSWNCPHTIVTLGTQAIKINVYAQIDNGTWTIQATYITNTLITKELMPATWGFSLNLDMQQLVGNTTSILTFGDSDHRSTVTGVTIVTPKYPDIQLWQWMNCDFIGLIIGSYLYIIGPVIYLLVYALIFGSLYLRHRTASPVVFIAIIFGGGFGLGAWVLLPLWAALPLSIFVILAIMAIIFKVIR